MEIIKRGQLPADKIYEGECLGCGTEVRFAKKEGRLESDNRDGDAIVVACPVCNRDIWVQE